MISIACLKPDLFSCWGAYFKIHFVWKMFEELLMTKHFIGTALSWGMGSWGGDPCFLKYGSWHFWWYLPNYVQWHVSLTRCSERWSPCSQSTAPTLGGPRCTLANEKLWEVLEQRNTWRNNHLWYSTLNFQTSGFSKYLRGSTAVSWDHFWS